MGKRKILVSAYGCEPFRGSEAGVGWNWILQMAKDNELHVIVRANDKQKIEQHILEHEQELNIHFYYYDTSSLFLKLKKKDKGLYLYYWFWQIGIIPLVKKIIKEQKPDYTMHLTFGSMWMPTFLPLFKVPFIWGPLGGADGVPKQFLRTLPLKQRIIQTLRYVLIDTACMNPLITIPSKKAIAILCRTANNANAIPQKYRNKTHVVLETAMEQEVFAREKDYALINEKVEIVVSGRLVPFKNVIMAVDAMNELIGECDNIHMTIIGDGCESRTICNAIKRYALEEQITMIPMLPREDVLAHLERADILAFPSLREGGSWALMEGMAIGLPVVCLDWTGMSTITNEQCAIRITPSEPQETMKEFANALKTLVGSHELRASMGQAGRDRIKTEFDWNQKETFMKNLFEQLER